MPTVGVILTLPDEPAVFRSATTAMLPSPNAAPATSSLPPGLPSSFALDDAFPAVPLALQTARNVRGFAAGAGVPTGRSASAFAVRAHIEVDQLNDLVGAMRGPGGENRVFSDPGIGAVPTCGGDPPVGTSLDVQRLLGAGRLAALGMDGKDVALAIVDTGINLEHLRARGFSPSMSYHGSWSPAPAIPPGAAPVDHGTMCAYAALLSAPRATLLDYAVLQSRRQGGSVMDGFLSDAVLAYDKLLQLMTLAPEERFFSSLVVNNSWGMFHPSWDFPPGHPGRYSDNPNHPFNLIVGSLASAGTDILFAAGNCGPTCPDRRCLPTVSGFPAVNGANSHPEVLAVAGVDTNRALVGYSSHGPGALANNKPDFAAYTHFLGSEAFGSGTPDSGTSTSCPVAAGIVAALRSRYPYESGNPRRTPGNVRDYLRNNAVRPSGPAGWTPDLGTGIIDTANFPNAASVL